MRVLFTAVLVLGIASSALAADPKFLTGVSMGSGSYSDGVGTKMAWGVNGEVRISPELEAGISYRKSKLAKDETSSLGVDVSYLLVDGSYRMPAGGGYFTAGLQAGSAKVATTLDLGIITLEGDSENKFAAGPKLGYEFPVSEHIELGASADYLVVFTNPKIKSFGLLASAAYQF